MSFKDMATVCPNAALTTAAWPSNVAENQRNLDFLAAASCCPEVTVRQCMAQARARYPLRSVVGSLTSYQSRRSHIIDRK